MIEESYLEIAESEFPDGIIPNFPQKVLFSTFVDPCGPALSLASHFYFTSNLQGMERDPTEQLKWLRTNLPYFSMLAKSIQQIRNKLAHSMFLEGKMFKTFVRYLSDLDKKKTQAQQLVDVLVQRTIEIINCVTNSNVVKPDKELKPELEENRKQIAIYEFGNVKSLIPGHVYWLQDIREHPVLKNEIKGKNLMLLDGKFRSKKIIFRSWSGNIFNAEFLDEPELGRKTLRYQQLVLLLD